MAASCSSVNAKRPRRASLQSQIKTDAQAVSCARGAQLSRLSDAWSPRWRARGEKERQFHAGGRAKETNMSRVASTSWPVSYTLPSMNQFGGQDNVIRCSKCGICYESRLTDGSISVC